MAQINSQAPASGQNLAEDARVVNIADKAEEYLGGKGFKVIADTAATTPAAGQCFVALQMLSDTVLNTVAAHASAPITGTITGITLGTNVIIYGKFTSVKLTSGSLIAYNGILQ